MAGNHDTGNRSGRRLSILHDPKARGLILQAAVALTVVWFGYELVSNTIYNLEKRQIASGFGFLDSTAGFSIVQTLIPYSEQSSYGTAFLVGLTNTLLVSAIGIVLATLLGFLIGIARLSPNWLISRMAAVYIEVFRNIPLLLQILFWYSAVLAGLPSPRQSLGFADALFINNRGFFMPRPVFETGSEFVLAALVAGLAGAFAAIRWAKRRQRLTGESYPAGWIAAGLVAAPPLIAFALTGAPMSAELPALKGFNFAGGMRIIPEFAALVTALSIYTAAFIAETVRAGILSVSSGQTEAARSLGLRRGLTLRLVVIPQAMRVIVPPLTSQYLNLTKNSSLAVAIAYPDLVAVFAGTVLNQTGQAIEAIALTMAVYLTISLATAAFMNWYNARIALVEH